MNRVRAREQQRIEQCRETGVQIPPAGIEIQHVWRDDDRQPARPKNPMELTRERELILDVLDHFQAARDVDRLIVVWETSVGRNFEARDLRVPKEFGKNVAGSDYFCRLESELALDVLAEELGEKPFAGADVGYANTRLEKWQDDLEHLVVGAAVRDRAYLIFDDDSGHAITLASCSRASARSGFISRTGNTGSEPRRSRRSSAFLIVNVLGSRESFTSSQSRGIDTVAPGNGRTLNGATM